MFQLVQTNDDAADIEQFRTLHRRLFRTQHEFSKTETLDEDDGRKRKIFANWRQKQQQARTNKLQNDGHWSQTTATKPMVNLNAFNYSTSYEAFDREPCDAVSNADAWPLPHYMAW
ncbi:unnamed protein product [Peronospora destructor]|uniref:Uncharacterized protein n=1 Tax=Peronospora destructor TaxID=86335 RepID=A0AAV0TPM5_9STRA|nr:unnamed protein product [Peronospora destructor]